MGERQDAEFHALSASGDTNTSFGVLLDFLFSWAFVPVSLLFAVLKLIFVINFSKKLNVQVQDQAAIVFYGASMSIISTFVIGLTVAFLPFVYGLSITIFASILFYTFPKKFGYVKSPIDFLPEQGKELQKVHSRASLMLALISIAFVLLYVFFAGKVFYRGLVSRQMNSTRFTKTFDTVLLPFVKVFIFENIIHHRVGHLHFHASF